MYLLDYMICKASKYCFLDMMGKTDKEKIKADEMVHAMADLQEKIFKVQFAKKDETVRRKKQCNLSGTLYIYRIFFFDFKNVTC